MKARALRFALTSALLASAGAIHAQPPGPQLPPPVQTDKGKVQGYPGIEEGVTAYMGIPFGKPPVGDLRWKVPQPVDPWDGVLDAKYFKPACIQNSGLPRYKNLAIDLAQSPGMSEDCLYLNVWTPAKSADEKLPVMLWLYGGAYTDGGGNSPYNRGDHMAAKGVIYVSMNYRLGALGFMTHPELDKESGHDASGNYALADVIAVLKWIKANIAAFGGDPDNVTIFGQSAGAAIAGGLLGSPQAAGLFNREIDESGGYMALGIGLMTSRENAEKQTMATMDKLGNPTLAELRAMPAREAFAKLGRHGMVVDGWIIPQDVSLTVAEGKQNKVDIIAGSNGNEGGFIGGFGPPMTAARWQESATQRWGDLAELGMAAYPAVSDDEAKAASSMPFSDGMAWQARWMAMNQAKLGQQGWFYHFTHRVPYAPGKPDIGPTHASEVAYVLGTLDEERLFPDGSSRKVAERDPAQWAFSDQVMQYWVNFARTGNPNGPGLPEWPAVTALKPTQSMLLTGAGSGAGDWASPEKVTFYSSLFNRDVAQKLGLTEIADLKGAMPPN